jgi:hypothetical protein
MIRRQITNRMTQIEQDRQGTLLIIANLLCYQRNTSQQNVYLTLGSRLVAMVSMRRLATGQNVYLHIVTLVQQPAACRRYGLQGGKNTKTGR